jgi:hypothetical protein
MTPHADPFDGKLTLAFGYRGTRWYVPGVAACPSTRAREAMSKWKECASSTRRVFPSISIRPSPAHTDGELLPQWIKDFEYEIQPKRINMIVP